MTVLNFSSVICTESEKLEMLFNQLNWERNMLIQFILVMQMSGNVGF